jgi:hypothetical protein
MPVRACRCRSRSCRNTSGPFRLPEHGSEMPVFERAISMLRTPTAQNTRTRLPFEPSGSRAWLSRAASRHFCGCRSVRLLVEQPRRTPLHRSHTGSVRGRSSQGHALRAIGVRALWGWLPGRREPAKPWAAHHLGLATRGETRCTVPIRGNCRHRHLGRRRCERRRLHRLRHL